VGDFLQIPNSVGHVFISLQWDVRCLFGWVMLASASKTAKMLPLYKRRKANRTKIKQAITGIIL
jgi:hypothetical protein